MKPNDWDSLPENEKKDMAESLAASIRGVYLISQALEWAIHHMKDEKPYPQTSNIEDMEMLRYVYNFPVQGPEASAPRWPGPHKSLGPNETLQVMMHEPAPVIPEETASQSPALTDLAPSKSMKKRIATQIKTDATRKGINETSAYKQVASKKGPASPKTTPTRRGSSGSKSNSRPSGTASRSSSRGKSTSSMIRVRSTR